MGVALICWGFVCVFYFIHLYFSVAPRHLLTVIQLPIAVIVGLHYPSVCLLQGLSAGEPNAEESQF